MTHYRLFFDGSCGPKNPGGTAAYGFALLKDGQEEPVETGHGIIGSGADMSNNLAEFEALYKGLCAFWQHWKSGPAHVSVFGDSNLVIQIMNRHWKATPGKLYYAAYERAWAVLRDCRRLGVAVTFDWVPREQNTLCDDLSKAHAKE